MIIKEWQQERSRLEYMINHHLSELQVPDNPSGILLCQKNGGSIRWKRKYLYNSCPITRSISKKDYQLAQQLTINLYRMVNIGYLLEKIRCIDQLTQNPNADMFERRTENNLYEQLTALQKNVHFIPRKPSDFFVPGSPYSSMIILFLQKEYAWVIDWYLGKYPKSDEYPENLLFPVELGYMVRSKSEAMAADILYREGVLFHYDERLLLSNGQDIYPDFTIPLSRSETLIWEHFGAMDSSKYLIRTKGKILDYVDDQWLPGINMITTYESKKYPMTKDRFYPPIKWIKSKYLKAFPDLPADESLTLYDLARQPLVMND